MSPSHAPLQALASGAQPRSGERVSPDGQAKPGLSAEAAGQTPSPTHRFPSPSEVCPLDPQGDEGNRLKGD